MHRFLGGHPGRRLVHQNEIAVLGQQQCDLERLRLPMREVPCRLVEEVLQTNQLSKLFETVTFGAASEPR